MALTPWRQDEVTLFIGEHHVELVPRDTLDLVIALEPLNSGFEVLVFGFEGFELVNCAVKLIPLVEVAACREDAEDKNCKNHESEQGSGNELRERPENWSWFVRSRRL